VGPRVPLLIHPTWQERFAWLQVCLFVIGVEYIYENLTFYNKKRWNRNHPNAAGKTTNKHIFFSKKKLKGIDSRLSVPFYATQRTKPRSD
jgi:hypothetical protein